MLSTRAYGRKFFRHHAEGAVRSARVVVPVVLDRVSATSVVDVGCGVGSWLSVFMEHGVTDVFGIDGAEPLPGELVIPDDKFLVADLRYDVDVGRRFDLAVCLEVAEHLPTERADSLVEFLTDLSPVVLFSAAVPFPGGTNHVNEQWPDYWAARFARNGHQLIDCVRPRVWQTSVEYWYAQNTFVYASEEGLQLHPELARSREESIAFGPSVIHPRGYLRVADPRRMSLKTVIRLLPRITVSSLARRLRLGWSPRKVND